MFCNNYDHKNNYQIKVIDKKKNNIKKIRKIRKLFVCLECNIEKLRLINKMFVRSIE